MSPEPVEGERPIDAFDFYWRRGCPFCTALRRRLERTGIPIRYHDIWSDEHAAARVRSAARGYETVPAIGIGAQMLVNPAASTVLATLTSIAPDLVPVPADTDGSWLQRVFRGRPTDASQQP